MKDLNDWGRYWRNLEGLDSEGALLLRIYGPGVRFEVAGFSCSGPVLRDVAGDWMSSAEAELADAPFRQEDDDDEN